MIGHGKIVYVSHGFVRLRYWTDPAAHSRLLVSLTGLSVRHYCSLATHKLANSDISSELPGIEQTNEKSSFDPLDVLKRFGPVRVQILAANFMLESPMLPANISLFLERASLQLTLADGKNSPSLSNSDVLAHDDACTLNLKGSFHCLRVRTFWMNCVCSYAGKNLREQAVSA